MELDGSPRPPDEEGVVVAVDRKSIELEDGKKFGLSEDLVSFSTVNRHTISVLGTVGDYVHLGVDGDTVVWLARVGRVTVAEDKPVVLYQGEIKEVQGDRLLFADGTVLRLEKGLEVGGVRGEGFSLVAIDPKTERVQGVTLPPSGASATSTTTAS